MCGFEAIERVLATPARITVIILTVRSPPPVSQNRGIRREKRVRTLHARMHAVFFKRKHQSLRKVFMHVLHCCVGCPQSFGFSSSSFVFSLVCLLYIVVQRQDMILVWGGVAFIFASNECCSIITSGRRGKSNGFLYHRCWVEGRMLYQDLICTAV